MQPRQSWKIVGALAFLPHLIAVVLTTFMRPDFDHARQYLSELGERGSSTQLLMDYGGIIPTGLMIALFGVGLTLLYSNQERIVRTAGILIVVHGLCRIAAGSFPCDAGCRPDIPSLSQQIHNLSASVGYVALTTAAFFMGAYFIIKRQRMHIIACSYAAGIIASVALFMLTFHPGMSTGLYQRIALGVLQAWITYLAIYLAVTDRKQTPTISTGQ